MTIDETGGTHYYASDDTDFNGITGTPRINGTDGMALKKPVTAKTNGTMDKYLENQNRSNKEESVNGLLSEESFTEFFDTVVNENSTQENPTELERKKEEIIEAIQTAKKFYFMNTNGQLLLNHETYLRFRCIENFKTGFKYNNMVERMTDLELMCQLVNERYRIRWTCRKLYFHELHCF